MGATIDPQLLSRVGASFRTAGFTEEAVRAALRLAPGTSIGILDRPLHLRRLTGTDSISVLVKLLVLGSGQPADVQAAALAPVTPEDLVSCGFVTSDAGVVRAVVRVTPYDGLLLAHDPEDDGVLARAHVGGVGPAARTLACLTPRTSAGRALDLGTGCGVQALLAARHISAVVAVDVNPRALWLTEINAALNDVSTVEARLGSLYDPVVGEEFDLIVANPPFVISPDHEYTFRDGGMSGDSMSRSVVIGAADALAPGGTALVLCNWVEAEGAGPPVAAWVAGSACDVLLLHYETVDPLTYACRWALPGSGSSEETESRLDRWLDYYQSNGVGAIGLGAVVLRRSSTPSPWARTFEMTSGPSGRAGEQLVRMLDAADQAAGVDDDSSVLESVFALVDGHRLN